MPSTFLAFALAGVVATSANAQTPLRAELIASGFSNPVFLTSPPGDESRLFVVEQKGLVRIIEDGSIQRQPYLDVTDRIGSGLEKGLLGLAFHPDYSTNGFVYVDYTRLPDGATVVERFRMSSTDPGRVDPSSGTIMLGPIAQPDVNHNGGCIAFGPDGYLYVGMGDGGGALDPNCYAQSGQSLLGKILRIDVDSPSRIPRTNPFIRDPNVLNEIWALGLRNPWRFSFDRRTGDLFIGDVGQGAREEIDFQPAASAGGENYGWRVMEGDLCIGPVNCPPATPNCNAPSLTRPIHVYGRTSGCSIIGGYVYRGCAIPGLRGAYLFADFCSRRVWSLTYDGQMITGQRELTSELFGNDHPGHIMSFGEDARGELYILDRAGRVFRIVAAGPPTAVDLGFGEIGGNGLVPRFEVCGMLAPGYNAQFILRRAPVSSAAILLLGTESNPRRIPGFGTLVPSGHTISIGVASDRDGRVQFEVVAPPIRRQVWYGQWFVVDILLPSGIGLSNAVQITIG